MKFDKQFGIDDTKSGKKYVTKKLKPTEQTACIVAQIGAHDEVIPICVFKNEQLAQQFLDELKNVLTNKDNDGRTVEGVMFGKKLGISRAGLKTIKILNTADGEIAFPYFS